jgi:hypothetical protein
MDLTLGIRFCIQFYMNLIATIITTVSLITFLINVYNTKTPSTDLAILPYSLLWISWNLITSWQFIHLQLGNSNRITY